MIRKVRATGYNSQVSLRDDVAHIVIGGVSDDPEVLKAYSRDTSIFERMPELVAFPKDADDVAALVKYVRKAKEMGRHISLTGRAAGTDMSGGPLTDSIVVSFTKHMNRVLEVGYDTCVAEPGVYYRDLEKATLKQTGRLIPPYPASRELCALGGMLANNCAGELTLLYGKMNRYVLELDVVLSDGSRATFHPLSKEELKTKKKEQTLEGDIYRRTHKLIEENEEEIENARPSVSKNSAGYALWDVLDKENETFDLTQLIVGSQGTLALITRARVALEKLEENRSMLVVFLSDLAVLPEVVRRVRAFYPESFESYDNHTFKLAVRFAGDFLRQLGLRDAVRLGFAFLPEAWMAITGGIPKLVLLAEFASATDMTARDKAREARLAIADLPIASRLAFGMMEEKYWKIRRESFALLRKHIHGLHAAPFIEDIVVNPDDYPRFLPELNTLLSQYDIMYTIAGHIGNGNFHIIPLMDMKRPEHRRIILELAPKVYELVARYNGSITGEHNDGIMRTPYLHYMFSPRTLELFAEVKNIFDPLNIFNPGKKVGGTVEDIERYMIHT